MGLDITVYKVVPIGNRDPEKIEDYYPIGDSNLSAFSALSFDKTLQEYNWNKIFSDLGYNPNDLEWLSSGGLEEDYDKVESGDENAIIRVECCFRNKASDLYDAYLFLNKVWSKSYFEKREDLENFDGYKEFKEKYCDLLIQNGWEEDYAFFASGSGVNYFNLVNAYHFVDEKTKIRIIEPEISKKIEKCICVEEVGYQRKGANQQFYDDGMWDAPCVLQKDVLYNHWYKYFSDTQSQMDDFQINIVDKFIEGETFVIYH